MSSIATGISAMSLPSNFFCAVMDLISRSMFILSVRIDEVRAIIFSRSPPMFLHMM